MPDNEFYDSDEGEAQGTLSNAKSRHQQNHREDGDNKEHGNLKTTQRKDKGVHSKSPPALASSSTQGVVEPMTMDVPQSVAVTEDEEMQIAEALQEENRKQTEENIKADLMDLDTEEPKSEAQQRQGKKKKKKKCNSSNLIMYLLCFVFFVGIGSEKHSDDVTSTTIPAADMDSLQEASLKTARTEADSEEDGEVLSPLPTTTATSTAPTSSSLATESTLPDETLEDGEIADSPHAA